MSLPSTIHHGILNLPGASPESKATAERLLEQDRQTHHCLWGKIGFHNHLSHHILAAYDLGATAQQLNAIYESERSTLDNIHLADRKQGIVEEQHVNILHTSWTQFLGQDKYYACYVKYFTGVIAELGASQVLEQWVFSPEANVSGVNMVLRFVNGAFHPLIQTGYAVEFQSDAMLAQALAQAAIHSISTPEIFDLRSEPVQSNSDTQPEPSHSHRQPSQGQPLLAILRQAYDSAVMHPVMPYDSEALLSKRRDDALRDGSRAQEIIRLSNLWQVNTSLDGAAFEKECGDKIEEIIWAATLILVASGKRGRKPRLDFFLMHILNASLFLPSLVRTLQTKDSKAMLLRAVLPVMLIYLLVRGRPRIDAELMMSYSASPRPPGGLWNDLGPNKAALGDPRNDMHRNPWPEILASVVHAPDAHAVKVIRTLCYAARMYGTTAEGGALGAFLHSKGDQEDEQESHKGMARVDGTIFVRAAGIVMDTLGWVDFGQSPGDWDRSGLGWEDAWKEPEGSAGL